MWLGPLVLLGACAPALPPPAAGTELRHTNDVRAVLQVTRDDWRDDVSQALFYVDKIERAYLSRGVSRDALHFVVVFQGAAGYHVLNDTAFERFSGERAVDGERNPNADVVRDLLERGVRVELCNSTMRRHGWTEEDLLPGVEVVPNAYPRVIDLQMDGYALLTF